MKKIIMIIAITLVVALFVSIGVVALDKNTNLFSSFFKVVDESKEKNNIVASVNGEPIYRSMVDVKVSYNNMIYSMNKDIVSNNAEKLKIKNEEEILEELIESRVIIQEAKRLNLDYAYEKAFVDMEKSYNIVKDMNDENYKFLVSYMEAANLTESEYLKIAAQAYADRVSRANLKSYYGKLDKKYDSFEDYIKGLVSEATIVYVNK